MYVAIDTEFVWERTYYANLGLIQVALSPDFDSKRLPDAPPAVMPFAPVNENQRRVRLLDPIRTAPAVVADVVADASVVKILHDAGQDLQHVHHWCGALPVNVFDTRLAAGFCGLPSTLSLRQLLKDTLGVDLPKTETRTNWMRRPLSDAQLLYAADDVACLGDVQAHLVARARELGTVDWMMEEMGTLNDPARYTEDAIGEAWRRMKVPVTAFKTVQQRLRLRALAAWREETARRQNLPRSWVVGDKDIVAAALNPPARDSLPPKVLPRPFSGSFYDVLEAAEEMSETEAPEFTSTASKAEREQADRVIKITAEIAAKHQIDPALFGSRADMTAYCRDPDNPAHPLNRGWRRIAMGTSETCASKQKP